MKDDITGVVLAGGRSSRMGVDKALVKINQYPMIDYALAALRPNCKEVIISSNHLKTYRDFEIRRDALSIQAPFVGLYSCLKSITTDLCFVLSCDMPLITSDFVRWLLSMHPHSSEITVPMHPEGTVEPLCAIYSKSVLPLMEEMILDENYQLKYLIHHAKSRLVNVQHRFSGFPSLVFSNINTPEGLTWLKRNASELLPKLTPP